MSWHARPRGRRRSRPLTWTNEKFFQYPRSRSEPSLTTRTLKSCQSSAPPTRSLKAARTATILLALEPPPHRHPRDRAPLEDPYAYGVYLAPLGFPHERAHLSTSRCHAGQAVDPRSGAAAAVTSQLGRHRRACTSSHGFHSSLRIRSGARHRSRRHQPQTVSNLSHATPLSPARSTTWAPSSDPHLVPIHR